MNFRTTSISTYLSTPGLICALGAGQHEVAAGLFAGDTTGMLAHAGWLANRAPCTGIVSRALPQLPDNLAGHYQTRNNQLLLAAAQQIEPVLRGAIAQHGASRVGVVLGTSTSGINDAVRGITHRQAHGCWPDDHDYRGQMLCAPSDFLAEWLGAQGPTYTVSTACTSGARALLTARRLLRAGLCDAVVCGAADSLCRLTLSGFASLEAISDSLTQPFSENRCGINIGEGATLFLMQRTPMDAHAIALLGGGASADAWHISAPEPSGRGAVEAMLAALSDAGQEASQIGWVNLHGTGTLHNDAMESHAMQQIFPNGVSCASTKPLTGHTLGNAGALEAALCWLTLSSHNDARRLPPHVWDGEPDPSLPRLMLTGLNDHFPDAAQRVTMSNSFAFGGNNVSLILGMPA